MRVTYNVRMPASPVGAVSTTVLPEAVVACITVNFKQLDKVRECKEHLTYQHGIRGSPSRYQRSGATGLVRNV